MPFALVAQVRLEAQATALPHALPSAAQVDSEFPWQRVELATHTSRRHSPLLQYRLSGQSLLALQTTQ